MGSCGGCIAGVGNCGGGSNTGASSRSNTGALSAMMPVVLKQLFIWVMAKSFDAMILGLNFQMIVTS